MKHVFRCFLSLAKRHRFQVVATKKTWLKKSRRFRQTFVKLSGALEMAATSATRFSDFAFVGQKVIHPMRPDFGSKRSSVS